MENIPAKTSLANDLANAMIRDVRGRGLKEGDRYYTTEEAGRKFCVSKETARKAMQILAGRDVLVRLQRRGTFVGPMAAVGSQPQTARKQILVLSSPVPYPAPPIEATQVPHFLGQAMGDMFIQDHLIPSEEDVSVIAEVIEAAKTTGKLEGVVCGTRTREVHEYLASLNIPIVFLGTLDSRQPRLLTLDLDYNQAGRLLAEHLITQGHRRVVVQLLKNCGGDHVFADSIADVMSAAKLPPNSLRVRTFNGDYQTARANLADLLRSDDRPTAIIARGRMLANTAAAAAEDAGLRVDKDIEIVWSSNALRVNNENSPYVNVQPKLAMSEVASLIADMLASQQLDKPLEERNVLIPAELCGCVR